MSFLNLNSHWLGLSAITAASLAGTFFLYQAEQDLPGRLSNLQAKAVKPKLVPELDLAPLDVASKLLAAPNLWKTEYPSHLFVSDHYILEDGQPKKPEHGSIHVHSKTKQPIPNSWFIQHKLPLFSSKTLLEDSDGDGFTNEEEWLAKTDPNDPKSHPPLLTKLLYTNQKVVNNRVRFLQYLGNPAKPDTLRITVRLEDPQQKQETLKIGDPIQHSDFAIKGFEARRKPDPSGTFSLDAPILLLVEKKTNRVEKAELQDLANFTDRTLYFKLSYSKEQKDFSVKPGDKIVLDETESYELIDASATSARVRSAAGAEIEINSTPQ